MDTLLQILQVLGDFMRHYAVFFVGYALLINMLAYALYALDKKAAKKREWRAREATLITVALLGGSIGALAAMKKLRHKTKHKKFAVTLPIVLVLQVALVAACLLVKGS